MRGIQVDGPRFRQIRQARGLTQQELAKVAGVAERTVRNAESGQRVRLEFLRYLTVVLGVELSQVIYDRDELHAAFQEQDRADQLSLALMAMVRDRDLSEYRNLMNEDHFRLVYWTSPDFPFAGEYRGFSGAQRTVELAEETFIYEEPLTVPEVRASGNFVILSGMENLRVRATGLSCTSWWKHIYEFADGRLIRLDTLVDTQALQAAFFP